MEVKKSYSADLEHRRGWFFLTGLAIALGMFFLALHISLTPGDEEADAEMLERIAEDMELSLNRPDKDMVAYQHPEPAAPEEKAKIRVVEQAVTTEIPEQLMKSQASQLDGEGAAKDSASTQKVTPMVMNQTDNPLNFRVVERLPEFPGGPTEFMKWLTQNLKYPEMALQKKIEGKVTVSFIVNTDGSTSEVKVAKSAHVLLDYEALRVMKMMPKWKPGEDKGKPCRTLMVIPVVFAR